MNVKLLNYTPNGDRTVAQAAKLCYSASSIDGILEKMDQGDTDKFIQMLKDLGHESPLEHISFTFGIEGVSRVTETQLVRHRIGSYSIQSGRYVTRDNFEYAYPESIIENVDAAYLYEDTMSKINSAYNTLLDLGVPKEDARLILPQGMKTKIIMTMNMRSLLHFFELRLCDRAQWEIRDMADMMLVEVKKIYPNLFKNVGPACVKGKCPEGKMSCGKQEKMRAKYKEEI